MSGKGGDGASTPPARSRARTSGASHQTETALPSASSLVDYYTSTPNGKRHQRHNTNLGSRADFSGIYSVWKTPTKQWSASKSRDSFSTGGSSDSSSKGSGSREQSHFREEELNDASFARDWEPGHHEEHISQKPYHQDNVAQKQGKSCAYVGTSELTSALEGLGVNSHGISDTRGDFPVENGSASAAGASPELKLPSGPILSPHRQSAIRFPHRQSAFEAVMLQQKLYEEMMRQEHGTNRHTQRHLSPPPREISQAPSQGLVTQQIASDPEISPPPRDISQAPSQGRANQQIVSGPEMHAGEGIHVPSLGLVICNKYVSIVSSGASPPGRLHRESPAEMTVGLVHIKKILPHSPASRCDAIAAGDEILAVNSFCCRGRTLEEIALFMTPTTHLHELFGPTQPAKPVHIISRRFSGASRGGLRQESLCHASIVPDDPFHPDSLAELSYDKRCGDMIEDSGNLCASLGAVEEAVFDKVLTSREKGLISRPAAPVGSVRKDGYITTWRSFPMMSLSVSKCNAMSCNTKRNLRYKWQAHGWNPTDVRMFLEWVFWRQDCGFSMIPSADSRIPTGTQLLAMSDESFGSMGFTHDETRVIRCVLGVLLGVLRSKSGEAAFSKVSL